MIWLKWLLGEAHQTTFYSVNRDGKLVLDVRGLLESGRMDRQLQAARQIKARKEAAA